MNNQTGGHGTKIGAGKNPWLAHLKLFRTNNPQMTYKDCMKNAKHTYVKKGHIGIKTVGTKEDGTVKTAPRREIYYDMARIRPMLKYTAYTDFNDINRDAVQAYIDRNTTDPKRIKRRDLFLKTHPNINIQYVHDEWTNLKQAWDKSEANSSKWRPKIKI